MKKKSRILIFLFVTIFLAAGITFAYAAQQQNTATNVVTVGKVSIELINKDEVISGGSISVGQLVSKEVKVKNIGTYPAFIRIKIKKEWTSTSGETIKISEISSDAIVPDCATDWVKGEGEDPLYTYYYYQNVLPANATVEFMNNYSVSLTNEMLEHYHGNSISLSGQITVQAEAIQSEFLETEVLEKNEEEEIVEWNGISFEGFVEDKSTPVPVSESAVTGTAVEFVGNAGDFVSFEQGNSDLFLSTKGMLPGQVAEQEINVKNTYKEEMEVFLSANLPEGITVEEKAQYEELLSMLEVHIESEKNGTLFEGTLLGHATNEGEISLGIFEVGAGDKLTISIKLSPKWNTPSCQTKVLWQFSTERKSINPPSSSGGGGGGFVVGPVVTATPTVEPTAPVTEAPTPELPTKEPVVTPKPTNEPLAVPGTTEEPKYTERPTTAPDAQATPKPKVTATPGFGPLDSPEIIPALTPEPTPEISKVTHDSEKPTPNVPEEHPTKTGDSTPIIFWAVMGGLSLVGCVVSGRKIWMMRE